MNIEATIQAHKSKLGEQVTCQIEIVTPTHVGSGVKLAKGLDFWIENNRTHLVNQDELMKYLQKNTDEIDLFDSEIERLKIFKKVGSSKTYNLECSGGEIFEFEREGNGRPYLPGSSIKGAIRTALLEDFLKNMKPEYKTELSDMLADLEEDRRTKDKNAADNILKKVFGKNPNENDMRVLAVGDAIFQNSDIDLERLFILNLKNTDYTWGWKKLDKDKRTYDSIKDASPLFTEMLKIGSKGKMTFRLDKYLLSERANRVLNLYAPPTQSIVFEILNRHAHYLLDYDLQFLRNCDKKNINKVLNSLILETENLKKQIPEDGTPESKHTCYLRMGWGSGWRSMTGDWLDNPEVTEGWFGAMRRKFRLGKFIGQDMFAEFPKTRKLIFNNDTPQYLTGWVKLSIV